MNHRPRPNKNFRFLCKDKKKSPVIGTPVYVKDEALKRENFPYEHRGGTIIEDWSFEDSKGKVYYGFMVQHKIGKYLWDADDLVEIGGLKLNFQEKEKSPPQE